MTKNGSGTVPLAVGYNWSGTSLTTALIPSANVSCKTRCFVKHAADQAIILLSMFVLHESLQSNCNRINAIYRKASLLLCKLCNRVAASRTGYGCLPVELQLRVSAAGKWNHHLTEDRPYLLLNKRMRIAAYGPSCGLS